MIPVALLAAALGASALPAVGDPSELPFAFALEPRDDERFRNPPAAVQSVTSPAAVTFDLGGAVPRWRIDVFERSASSFPRWKWREAAVGSGRSATFPGKPGVETLVVVRCPGSSHYRVSAPFRWPEELARYAVPAVESRALTGNLKPACGGAPARRREGLLGPAVRSRRKWVFPVPGGSGGLLGCRRSLLGGQRPRIRRSGTGARAGAQAAGVGGCDPCQLAGVPVAQRADRSEDAEAWPGQRADVGGRREPRDPQPRRRPVLAVWVVSGRRADARHPWAGPEHRTHAPGRPHGHPALRRSRGGRARAKPETLRHSCGFRGPGAGEPLGARPGGG